MIPDDDDNLTNVMQSTVPQINNGFEIKKKKLFNFECGQTLNTHFQYKTMICLNISKFTACHYQSNIPVSWSNIKWCKSFYVLFKHNLYLFIPLFHFDLIQTYWHLF